MSDVTGPQGWRKVASRDNRSIYHVEAPAIGDTFEISIIEPFPGVPLDGTRFPVMYVLDAFVALDIVAGTKRLFDIFSGGDVPPTYIVGIGYADPDVGARRFRDFTPTDAPLPAGLIHPTTFGLGGAARFLEFIRSDIIKPLEAAYPFDPTERALIGYSLSGLFAVHVLFSHPDTFKRYLIISPSLWWDDASIFGNEAAWARSNTDLMAKVLLVGGDAEEQPGGGWRNNLPDEVGLPLKQVSRLRELDRQLTTRNYAGLHLVTAFVADGRHITVFPAAVSLGLSELFKL